MGTQAWLPPSRLTNAPSYFSKILDMDPGSGPGPWTWTWTWKKSFRAPPSKESPPDKAFRLPEGFLLPGLVCSQSRHLTMEGLDKLFLGVGWVDRASPYP